MAKGEKKIIDEILVPDFEVENLGVEQQEIIIAKSAEEDVIEFLSGRGITHIEAINVSHEKCEIEGVVKHLKMTGKVGGDGSGRIWLNA